jgi:hypothetical protein
MSKKGKSRTRTARIDILKANERNARRKARAKSYDKQGYDGSSPEET